MNNVFFYELDILTKTQCDIILSLAGVVPIIVGTTLANDGMCDIGFYRYVLYYDL